MSILDTLITDRTQADVRLRTGKGHYNATDLNRVESAVEYLVGRLHEVQADLHAHADGLDVDWTAAIYDLPYDPGRYNLQIKTDWSLIDRPPKKQMERYLSNVKRLTQAVEANYPDLPTCLGYEDPEDATTGLNYEKANNIEQALIVMYAALLAEQDRITKLLNDTAPAWFYAGEIEAGEV